MTMPRTENHLSDVLRMLMNRAGIQSDNELADRLDAFENGQAGPAISQATISRILNGSTRDPRSETVRRIGRFFGVSESQMRGLDPIDGTAAKPSSAEPITPASSATTRAPRPGQPPNRYLPEADAVQVPAGLQCDKPVDGPSMQQLAKAYARFEEIRSAASSVPRVGIGSILLEIMRARDAVTDVSAKSPCARAIKAAAAKRAELSYLALKTFSAGDNIEHLHIETAATYAGIHYVKGRQMYGF